MNLYGSPNFEFIQNAKFYAQKHYNFTHFVVKQRQVPVIRNQDGRHAKKLSRNTLFRFDPIRLVSEELALN